MHISNQENWAQWVENNQQDEYGAAIIRYAERWADLMEARMHLGEKLETIAEETSHDADTEGITGFMYGCTVAVLASSWEYGECLRRWHNLATQLHSEGEKANQKGTILNPALLCIAE